LQVRLLWEDLVAQWQEVLPLDFLGPVSFLLKRRWSTLFFDIGQQAATTPHLQENSRLVPQFVI
jgi:hypothetical protein